MFMIKEWELVDSKIDTGVINHALVIVAFHYYFLKKGRL